MSTDKHTLPNDSALPTITPYQLATLALNLATGDEVADHDFEQAHALFSRARAFLEKEEIKNVRRWKFDELVPKLDSDKSERKDESGDIGVRGHITSLPRLIQRIETVFATEQEVMDFKGQYHETQKEFINQHSDDDFGGLQIMPTVPADPFWESLANLACNALGIFPQAKRKSLFRAERCRSLEAILASGYLVAPFETDILRYANYDAAEDTKRWEHKDKNEKAKAKAIDKAAKAELAAREPRQPTPVRRATGNHSEAASSGVTAGKAPARKNGGGSQKKGRKSSSKLPLQQLPK